MRTRQGKGGAQVTLAAERKIMSLKNSVETVLTTLPNGTNTNRRLVERLEPHAPLPGGQTVADEAIRRGGNRHEVSNLLGIESAPILVLPPRIAAVRARLDAARAEFERIQGEERA